MGTPEPLNVLFLSNDALMKHQSLIKTLRLCKGSQEGILILNLDSLFIQAKITYSN